MDKDDAWSLVDMIKAYFDDRSDVEDGDYGVPRPNKEMTFAQECDKLLTFLEKLP